MYDTRYIGDAVFAHFGGHGIEPKFNSRENECAVYSEPEVLQNLIEFWNSRKEKT